MTLENLELRHQNELAGYQSEREKRLIELKQDQSDLINGVSCANPKTYDLLQKLLYEQEQRFNQVQQDELDLLKHFHSLEREQFVEKQKMQGKLIGDIQNVNRDKSHDR